MDYLLIGLPGDFAVGGLLTFILFAIIILLIQMVILRWIFKINEQMNNQRAAVWFLMKIAEKQGVSAEEISQIMSAFQIK